VSLTTVSLMSCHSCTAGHPSVGDHQLLPIPTLALGSFLRLFAAPYGRILVPVPLIQCSASFYYGMFLRDLLVHRYGLRFHGVWFLCLL
jgi:hypothetical protein